MYAGGESGKQEPFKNRLISFPFSLFLQTGKTYILVKQIYNVKDS